MYGKLLACHFLSGKSGRLTQVVLRFADRQVCLAVAVLAGD
jgi:hypothetical protein